MTDRYSQVKRGALNLSKRIVDGALRSVYGYNESHRPLFDEVYDNLTARSTR